AAPAQPATSRPHRPSAQCLNRQALDLFGGEQKKRGAAVDAKPRADETDVGFHFATPSVRATWNFSRSARSCRSSPSSRFTSCSDLRRDARYFAETKPFSDTKSGPPISPTSAQQIPYATPAPPMYSWPASEMYMDAVISAGDNTTESKSFADNVRRLIGTPPRRRSSPATRCRCRTR